MTDSVELLPTFDDWVTESEVLPDFSDSAQEDPLIVASDGFLLTDPPSRQHPHSCAAHFPPRGGNRCAKSLHFKQHPRANSSRVGGAIRSSTVQRAAGLGEAVSIYTPFSSSSAGEKTVSVLCSARYAFMPLLVNSEPLSESQI